MPYIYSAIAKTKLELFYFQEKDTSLFPASLLEQFKVCQLQRQSFIASRTLDNYYKMQKILSIVKIE